MVLRREYRPLPIANDNPQIGDGYGLSPTSNARSAEQQA
jgi:hypothetical protein